MSRKNIRRTIARVTNQQRASRGNAEYYQAGRESFMGSSEPEFKRREARIAAAVPEQPFVHGIIREGSIFDE